MKTSLPIEKQAPNATPSTRREVIKQGLGLSLGSSVLGLAGLGASSSAQAWGPWHKFNCDAELTAVMTTLVPDYTDFWGYWKNSGDAMTKQLRLYAHSPQYGDITLGDSYYNVEDEYLGHNKDGFACVQVECTPYKTRIYEKVFKDGRVGTVQVGGYDEFRRKLGIYPDYDSPTRFVTAWSNAASWGYSFLRSTTSGFNLLGILIKETVYQNSGGGQVFFIEYAIRTENEWTRFCTADQSILAKIGSGVNLFTSNLNAASASVGDAAKYSSVAASVGFGVANLVQKFNEQQNKTVIATGQNATDTTYLRGQAGVPTIYESNAAVATAIVAITGTIVATSTYYKYSGHYRAARQAVILMLSLISKYDSPSSDGVYGNVPFQDIY
jgi:hypothetical protein